MIEQGKGGRVIAQVVPNVERKTLEPIIRANVKEGSHVYTMSERLIMV
jgi:transposase-like protein